MTHKLETLEYRELPGGQFAIAVQCCGEEKTLSWLTVAAEVAADSAKLDSSLNEHRARAAANHEAMVRAAQELNKRVGESLEVIVTKGLLILCLLVAPVVCRAQATIAAPMPVPRIQFLSTTGTPLAGGKVYTCVAGLTCPGNPQATYTDSTGSVQNANPVILDSGGFAGIWLGPLTYKIVVQNSAGVTQWTVDGVTSLVSAAALLVKDINGTRYADRFCNVIGTYNETCINNAVTDIAGSAAALRITRSFTLNASLSVPSNVTLEFDGGSLSPVAATTLTINGPIHASPGATIFGGAGSVSVANGAAVFAGWFSGADAGVKINAAIASLPAAGGTVDARNFSGAQTLSTNFWLGVTKPVALLLSPGTTWSTAVTLTPPTGSSMDCGPVSIDPGAGNLSGGCRFLWTGASTGTVMKVFDAYSVSLRGLALDCAQTGASTTTGLLIDSDNVTATTHNSYVDMAYRNCHTGVQWGTSSVSNFQIDGQTFTNNSVRNGTSDTTAIAMTINSSNAAQYSQVSGFIAQNVNIMFNILAAGPYFQITRAVLGQGIGTNPTVFSIASTKAITIIDSAYDAATASATRCDTPDGAMFALITGAATGFPVTFIGNQFGAAVCVNAARPVASIGNHVTIATYGGTSAFAQTTGSSVVSLNDGFSWATSASLGSPAGLVTTLGPNGQILANNAKFNLPWGTSAIDITATTPPGKTGLTFGGGLYGFLDFDANSSTGERLSFATGGGISFGSNTNAVYGSSVFTQRAVLNDSLFTLLSPLQLVSQVATGTAPFTVASTTPVANLSLSGGAGTTVLVNKISTPVNTVTFSATPAFDASLGNTQKITLTANVTSSTLSNAAAGQALKFLICQDATGGRTFTWPTTVKGGMTIGSTLSTCSAQTFIFDGANAYATGAGVTNM